MIGDKESKSGYSVKINVVMGQQPIQKLTINVLNGSKQ